MQLAKSCQQACRYYSEPGGNKTGFLMKKQSFKIMREEFNMKRNLMKWLAVLLVVGLLAATGAIASDESITGTIEKTDQGIVISADNGDSYIVLGKDLSDMVGETVTATGTLSEGQTGKTLTVISVEPAQK
jgi:hypothetical protein